MAVHYADFWNRRCDCACIGSDYTVFTMVGYDCATNTIHVKTPEPSTKPSELPGDFNWLAKHRPIRRWNTRSLGRSTMRRWTATVS